MSKRVVWIVGLVLLLNGSARSADEPNKAAPGHPAAFGAQQHEWAERFQKSLQQRAPGATSGKPAGGACPGPDSCELKFTPPENEVLVLTAVWSATKLQCDDATAASPRGGAPIAPGWRCERRLLVEGPGAGWTGFTTAK
jgi:hypothetical protein